MPGQLGIPEPQADRSHFCCGLTSSSKRNHYWVPAGVWEDQPQEVVHPLYKTEIPVTSLER